MPFHRILSYSAQDENVAHVPSDRQPGASSLHSPLCASVTSASSASVVEPPPATRTLAVAPFHESRERGRLREGHDRLEGQRGAMGVVAIGNAADRMAEDLDRGLRDVLVIVRRTRLAKIL